MTEPISSNLPPLSPGTPTAALSARVLDARQRWLFVSRDPDAWTDPAMRRAMHAARLAYQDAKLACVHAARSAGS